MQEDSYKITFQTWNKIASIYQDKFMNLDIYNDTYDLFCDKIEKINPQVLEIGCGPGNITRYILSKRPDLKIYGIDIAPNMIKLAKENNPTANFKVMDCREIEFLTKTYDAILCGFCMPYLSENDCNKLIKDSTTLLNSNGVLYFSTIEGDYSRSGYEAGSSGDKVYVYYHSESYLKKLLELNNVDLICIIKKQYSKTSTESSTHLIFIAKKR